MLKHDTLIPQNPAEGMIGISLPLMYAGISMYSWHCDRAPCTIFIESNWFLFSIPCFPQAKWPLQTSQYWSVCVFEPATPWGLTKTKQTNRWAGMGPPTVHHLSLGMEAVLLILFSHSAMKFYTVLNSCIAHQRWSSYKFSISRRCLTMSSWSEHEVGSLTRS